MGTGGGHGAPGGSQFESVTGGAMYDDTRVPIAAGSGGGNSSSGVGGAGGGFLNISTFYEVNVEGKFKTNENCSMNYSTSINSLVKKAMFACRNFLCVSNSIFVNEHILVMEKRKRWFTWPLDRPLTVIQNCILQTSFDIIIYNQDGGNNLFNWYTMGVVVILSCFQI